MLSICWNAVLCHGSHAAHPVPHSPVNIVCPWKFWGPTRDNLQASVSQIGAQCSGDSHPEWTFVLQGEDSATTLLPPAPSAECQHPASSCSRIDPPPHCWPPGQGTEIIALKSLSRAAKAASSTGETLHYICDKQVFAEWGSPEKHP